MMLSRLILNPLDREVRRMTADVEELHRGVLRGFEAVEQADARAHHGVLHRLETDERTGALVLLVQSRSVPDWDRWPREWLAKMSEAVATRSIDEELARLEPGTKCGFLLVANATRRVMTKSGPDGARNNGKRVPVRGQEGAEDWLLRKAKECGFELVREGDRILVDVRPELQREGRRRGGRLTFDGVRYEGFLRVVDADVLRESVVAGIGPAKAYGFGLLSVVAMR